MSDKWPISLINKQLVGINRKRQTTQWKNGKYEQTHYK